MIRTSPAIPSGSSACGMVWSRTDEAMHKIYRLLLEALDSLTANKMLSMLTILGIVIGVAAVIAMLSIGRGAEASITTSIESIGTNLVYVTPGSTSENGVNTFAGSA